MNTRYKKLITIVTAILLAILVVMSSAFKAQYTAFAAEESVVTRYENQNVMDDLKGATIDGKPFDVADYPYRANDKPRVLLLAEFCYSYYATKQSDYGLYVYIYNPQQLVFDTASDRNKIQIRYGNDKQFSKPVLLYLNASDSVGSEGRFLKFKIKMSLAERNAVLASLNTDSRVYELSGVELIVKGVSTEYASAQTYTYRGYAKGYGSEYAEENTLEFSVDNYDRVIDFDVHHTVYRPKGDFYNGEQCQLNSCFFRVPTSYFETYGRLTELMCEWYEYRTKPALVTENKVIYNIINGLKGKPLSSYSTKNGYITLQDFGNKDGNWFVGTEWDNMNWASNYDMKEVYTGHSGFEQWKKSFLASERFDNFSGVFYTADSYMDYSVRADVVKDELLNISKSLGGELYAGRYSSALFTDTVDAGHIRGYNPSVIISADDDMIIYSKTTTKEWWQKIFGGYDVTTEYDSMKAIVTLTEKDLNGSDATVAKALYISESDVPTLREEYKAAGKNETVVLLRYGTSEYFAAPCAAYFGRESDNEMPDRDTMDEWVARRIFWQQSDHSDPDKDTIDSYLSWQTVYLDFDIISLTFTDDDVSVVVPVVSSPTDAIGGITPPLVEDYHEGTAWWKIAVAVVLFVLIVILIYKLIKGILTVIFK